MQEISNLLCCSRQQLVEHLSDKFKCSSALQYDIIIHLFNSAGVVFPKILNSVISHLSLPHLLYWNKKVCSVKYLETSIY